MFAAYVIITVVTAAANLAAALTDFLRPAWLLDGMDRADVPRSWVFPLGLAKLAGSLGLLVGLAVRPIGLAAALALFVFFVGAVSTLVRARDWRWVPAPVTMLLLATGSVALGLVA